MAHPDDDFEAELDGFPTEVDPRRVRARERVEVLASEFAERCRRGEHPTLQEYVQRYPDLTDQINELFPMVAALEQWKSDRESDLLRDQLPDQFRLKQLGDCRIVREIGRGGMGVVFEALQGQFERRVAVKLLPWRISHVPHRQERFEREAMTIAKLKHANIVPIYSFGRQDDYAYYVMQYVRSVSLSHVIKRLQEVESISLDEEILAVLTATSPTDTTGRAASLDEPAPAPADDAMDDHLPPSGNSTGQRGLRRDAWKSFARVGVMVAQALRHAHQRGVLHNDVKPGNLLMDERSKVWVTDFGLAEEIDTANHDERVTGTLRYMAPERFEGINDVTSDVYSLGVTLLELVTRQPAFQCDDRSRLLEMIAQGTVCKARELEPTVPADLDAIISKATHCRSAERYQTAGELASDLLRFINNERVTARSHRRLFGWLRRRS